MRTTGCRVKTGSALGARELSTWTGDQTGRELVPGRGLVEHRFQSGGKLGGEGLVGKCVGESDGVVVRVHVNGAGDAPAQVPLEQALLVVREGALDKVDEELGHLSASQIHDRRSSKCRDRASRIISRARCSRLFTAGTDISSRSAISALGRCSTSASTNTSRYISGSPAMAFSIKCRCSRSRTGASGSFGHGRTNPAWCPSSVNASSGSVKRPSSRRALLRRAARAAFTVTRCSQVVNAASPRNVSSLRTTCTSTSWVTSSASASFPSIRRARLYTRGAYSRNTRSGVSSPSAGSAMPWPPQTVSAGGQAEGFRIPAPGEARAERVGYPNQPGEERGQNDRDDLRSGRMPVKVRP